MKSYVAPGESIPYVNPGAALDSGDVVVLPGGVGIVANAIAASGNGVLQVDGIISFVKKAATAFLEGAACYWDAAPGEITDVAADGILVGYCAKKAASGDAKIHVKLEYQADPSAQFGQAADVNFSAGSNLVGVDGTGSNAAPLTGTETRLDALDTAVLAIIASLQAANLMDS